MDCIQGFFEVYDVDIVRIVSTPHNSTTLSEEGAPMRDFREIIQMIVVPGSHDDRELYRRAAKYQFWYSVLGLLVGIICVVAGMLLLLHGIAGHTSWTASILGAKSELNDAAPGVVFAVLGLFVIWVSRFGISVAGK
jgi:hypothetical protein